MAVALMPKTKMFTADFLAPLTVPDGTSLEEKVNTFLATIPIANVMDVQVSLAKAGKYGENPVYVAYALYKG